MVNQNPNNLNQTPRPDTQDNLDRMEARKTRSTSGGTFIFIAIGLIAAIIVGAYVISDNDGTNDAAVTQPTSQSTIEVTPAAPATEAPAPQSDAAPAAPAPQADTAPTAPAPQTDTAPAGTANQ